MTGYWTLRPRDPAVFVPPSIEYDSVLTWLAAWPPRTSVLLVGHEGAVTGVAMVEELVDALALAPLVEELFDIKRG